MKETTRILNELSEPSFAPCPTCHRVIEIGEWCDCWKEYHMTSTLELVDSIMEEYHVNGKDGRAYRLAGIIKDWREDLGV